MKSKTFSLFDVLKSSGYHICFKLSSGCGCCCFCGGGGGCSCCGGGCARSVQAALAFGHERPEEEVGGDGAVVACRVIDTRLFKKSVDI
jgi:hypothetical protein